MMSGLEAATAIAPMVAVWKKPSETFFQVVPASVVFQTPPPVAPIQKVVGWAGWPATAVTRPPRNGPTRRHCRAW